MEGCIIGVPRWNGKSVLEAMKQSAEELKEKAMQTFSTITAPNLTNNFQCTSIELDGVRGMEGRLMSSE